MGLSEDRITEARKEARENTDRKIKMLNRLRVGKTEMDAIFGGELYENE